MKQSLPSSRRRHAGFSLVELMVALVIGLIVSLAIFQVLQTYEGRKRTTTSVNDIDQTGNFAIFELDKLVRSAGNGVTQGDGALLGCLLDAAKGGQQILPRLAPLPPPFGNLLNGRFRLTPILIVPGIGPHDSDVMVIMGGNSGYGEMAIPFAAAPQSDKLTLNNTLGFSARDLILLSERPGNDACLLTQANAVNAINGSISLSGDYYLAAVNGNHITDYSYVKSNPRLSAVASNLGNVANGNPPTFLVIGVDNSNALFAFDLLHSQNPLDGGNQAAYPIADGVWAMYARYGVDTDNDGVADTWSKAEGGYAPTALTTAESLQTIKAIRIGLILRTSLREKEAIDSSNISLFSDLGDSLKVTPFAAGGPGAAENAGGAAAADDEAAHYRYRAIEATIPLRNMLHL